MDVKDELNFYPLQVHSYYDFFESAMTPEEYAKGLMANGYSGGSLTDFLSFKGIAKYSNEFSKYNLNFVSGIEINLVEKEDFFTLLLYVQNEEGYRFILSLINSGKKVFNISDFNNITGVAAIIKSDNSNFFDEWSNSFSHFIASLASLFKMFYIGVEIYSEGEKEIAAEIRKNAKMHSIQTIAIPEIKYLSKSYFRRYCLLQAIKHKKLVDDYLNLPQCFFMLSKKALTKIYTEEEIKVTSILASSCSFNIFSSRGDIYHFFKTNEESDNFLKEKVLTKLKEKKLSEEYYSRALYELDIISKMGFSDYFLIVEDYVKYAKTHDIKVGPGRGSAASSLVSFLLNITEIDPIKHELIFERFLNPSRVTMPDIDIDFEDTKRENIINYLKEKYGEDRVKQIITYSNFKSSSSLNALIEIRSDVRIEYVKRISNALKYSKDLKEALQYNKAIREISQDQFYLEIIKDAMLIEGFPNNTSKHASGVILNNEKLNDLVPTRDGIIEFEFADLEKMHFLKLDILGLSNLSFIRKIEDKILSHCKTLPLVDDEHLDDKLAFDVLSIGNTLGIFQLESSGMKDAIKKVNPNCFDDLVALIALYRPGPIDNISTYALNKKNPDQIKHYTKEIDDVLKSTNNIIIYQEQIMAIVKNYAGLSSSVADSFRKAIAKKDSEKMEKYKEIFYESAKEKGKDIKEIEEIYKLIEKFALYGFNKAHSVSYALISFKLLVYKTHFPLEFYECLLENGTLNFELGKALEDEFLKINKKIMGPRILFSGKELVEKDNVIYFPYSIIKGLDKNTINSLLEFNIDDKNLTKEKSIYSIFCYLLDNNVSENDLKKLIDAGVFSNFEENREVMRYNFSSLATCNMLEENNSFVFLEKEKNYIEDYIREYSTLGFVFNNPLKEYFYKNSDVFIILHCRNYNSTEFEALNNYGILNLYFSEKVELHNNVIIKVTGRRNKMRYFVDSYIEVKL